MGYKYGNWILTLRERFFVLNPSEGTFIRYKKRAHYPSKPMEIIPIKYI